MSSAFRTVVLDDDPTGIQTVHGCRLITRWDAATVRSALCDEVPFFFVLTNTRAMTLETARARIREIARTVLGEARSLGVTVVFVSRSDSTLRSSFPLECSVIRSAMGEAMKADAMGSGGTDIDALFLVPAFFEGGRVTRDDVHLIRVGRRSPTDSARHQNLDTGSRSPARPDRGRFACAEEQRATRMPAAESRCVPR